MRNQALFFMLGLGFAAGGAQAETKRLAAKPATESKVVELGKIGAATPSEDEKTATLRTAPTKQAMLAALNTRQNGGNLTLGPTYRVTPSAPYNAYVGTYFRCWTAGQLRASSNGGSWQCDSGQSNELRFDFRELSPNATYLATVDHAFIGSVDVVTQLNGEDQTTTIESQGPLYLVFQTGAGQTTATVKIKKIRGSAYMSAGSWYSLDLAKVQ